MAQTINAGSEPATGEHSATQQLEQEIAETRERLGETVEELVSKLDVKSQLAAGAAGLLIAALVAVLLRRKR
jgi:uncharacterized protein DUF3618